MKKLLQYMLLLASVLALPSWAAQPPPATAEASRAFHRPSAGDNPGEKQPAPSGYPIPPAPVLSPAEALKSFRLAPGYRIELVASEPMIAAPVAMDFGPDGSLWVVEMRGYQNNPEGTDRLAPTGRVVVLEDLDGDGKMDRSTVYMDGLVLPRAIKVLSDGVLVAEPPYLWHTRDTDGDGRADEKSIVTDDYSPREGNPARAASGLIWGIDNWIHSSTYSSRLRRVEGKWIKDPVPVLGDFGLGMDDYGRTYHNGTSGPLRANLVSSHYQLRNPNHNGAGGVYELITSLEEREVWPVRPTPGVNRGYMKGMLRPEGTLVRYTACCGISIFRGDCLPAEVSGNHFIAEPAANLVRRSILTEEKDGRITARNAYRQAEFLASTDERFRPVNMATGPDGTLYVVDMYRGILESHPFVTTYLKRQIYERGLDRGADRGRIYRVVHESIRPGPAPRLSRSSTAELLAHLSHSNGWWRDTAQRLLVERGDHSVVPELRRLARNSSGHIARLHAYWTLDGLAALTDEDINMALTDEHPKVRSPALRWAEPSLQRPDGGKVAAAVLRAVDDPDAGVRLQAAMTLGEMPGAAGEAALARLLLRHPGQPFIVDAVVSGLRGRELEFLERLAGSSEWKHGNASYERIVAVLAAAIFVEGSPPRITRLLDWTAAPARPISQKMAVLGGVSKPLRLASSISLPAALTDAPDEQIRSAAGKLVRQLSAVSNARGAATELSAHEQQLFKSGAKSYGIYCAQCHQANGRGLADTAAPLAGSKWVLGSGEILARIVLHGKQRQSAIMPPWGNVLDDQSLAAILTYIRRAWGNDASPVLEADVRKIRAETTGVRSLWTEESLAELVAGRSKRSRLPNGSR